MDSSWQSDARYIYLHSPLSCYYGSNIDRLAPDEVTTKLPELCSTERLLYAKSKAVICRNSWSETLLLQETT
jgi:hypothetical protein